VPLESFSSRPLDGRNKLPIVYHSEYNISFYGIEKMHPFDSKKYGRVADQLMKNGFIADLNRFHSAEIPTLEQLQLVHSDRYLCSVLHSSFVLTKILEIPLCCVPTFLLRKKALTPMLLATGGTISAAELAVRNKSWAINLGGGYHHAEPSNGSGFCVFADISIAIAEIKRNYADLVTKFMIGMELIFAELNDFFSFV
jgi:histone deacetylase 11